MRLTQVLMMGRIAIDGPVQLQHEHTFHKTKLFSNAHCSIPDFVAVVHSSPLPRFKKNTHLKVASATTQAPILRDRLPHSTVDALLHRVWVNFSKGFVLEQDADAGLVPTC